MLAPRLNMPKHKLTEDRKMSNIIIKLCTMGYDVCEAKDAISGRRFWWMVWANFS